MAYIVVYSVQVGFQVSFQVYQDAGHLKSDLESPVVSFGLEISGRARVIDKLLLMYMNTPAKRICSVIIADNRLRGQWGYGNL